MEPQSKPVGGKGKLDRMQEPIFPADNRTMNSEIKKKAEVVPPEQLAYGEGFTYVDDQVKDYEYSDFVSVTASVRGMFLSFGKNHPQGGKPIVFQETLIPLDVAHNLAQIMLRALESLKSAGVIAVDEPTDKGSK
jgi:hypothetical protein